MDAREPQDLEQLLQQSNWLQRIARGLVRDPSEADDLVQDTWVAALSHAPAAGAADLRAWMRVVARNFAHGSRRAAGRRAEHEPQAAREERIDGPDELAARFELQRRLGEAVLALEPGLRDAIVARYIDGLSTIQVAERLGLAHDAARQRISRGLSKLRERLDREHEGGRAGWMGALLPFTRTSTATITGGLLVMSLTLKLALLGAALLLGAGLWIHSNGDAASTPGLPAGSLAVDASRLDSPEAPGGHVREALDASILDPQAAAAGAEGPAIRGEVLDSRGDPVAGARILAVEQHTGDLELLDPDIAGERRELGRTHSDAQGQFRLPVPPGRALQLEVDAEARGLAYTGERRAGEFVRLRVRPGAELHGRVTLARDGSPLAGARLRAQLRLPDKGQEEQLRVEFAREVESDAQGRYAIAGLPEGRYDVEILLDGNGKGLARQLDLSAGTSTQSDLALEDLVRVHGFVRDARTHQPIAGAEVCSGRSFTDRVRSDAAGEYSLSASLPLLDEVSARAPGYGRCERHCVLPGMPLPADGRLDLELSPGRACAGRVLTRAGEPVEGAYVAAGGSEYDGHFGREDWRATRTDTEGRFELDDLRADVAHALLVRKPGFATHVHAFPSTEKESERVELADVFLGPALALSGEVVDGSGRPVPRAKVILRGGWSESAGGSWLDVYVAKRKLRTDELGRFSFGELAAGTYRLEAYAAGHNDPVERKVELGEGSMDPLQPIVLPDGLPLEGVVRDEQGQGVPLANVSIEPESGDDCGLDLLTDARGRFRSLDVPAGLYRVHSYVREESQDPSRARYLLPNTLAHVAAGRTDLEIVLGEGAWIVGRVLESDGRAASNFYIFVEDAQGKRIGGRVFANEPTFRVPVTRGVACTLIARPTVERSDPSESVGFDTDERHALRLPGILPGGPELELRLPPR